MGDKGKGRDNTRGKEETTTRQQASMYHNPRRTATHRSNHTGREKGKEREAIPLTGKPRQERVHHKTRKVKRPQ
jgi:hypothetical protein